MIMSIPLIFLIFNTSIGHISYRGRIQPLVLNMGAAFQLCIGLFVFR